MSSKPLNNDTAETKTLQLLRQCGFSYIQELDWLAKRRNKDWLCIEVKEKSRIFTPPPFYGLGLDNSQFYLRHKLHKELGIRSYLVVYVQGDVYGAFLDDLEAKGDFYITLKSDIRIYPIDNFSQGTEAIGRDLNGQ